MTAPVADELRSKAVRLFRDQVTGGLVTRDFPLPGATVIAETPTGRGASSLTFVRLPRKPGQPPLYFIQSWRAGPGGMRQATSSEICIAANVLPLFAEAIATVLDCEIAAGDWQRFEPASASHDGRSGRAPAAPQAQDTRHG